MEGIENGKKKVIITSFIIGSILLVVGFYYCAIKAGIPYQDASYELLQEYNRNIQIGENLMFIGFAVECVVVCFWGINFIVKK